MQIVRMSYYTELYYFRNKKQFPSFLTINKQSVQNSFNQPFRHRIAVAILLGDEVVVVLKEVDNIVSNANGMNVRDKCGAELVANARLLDYLYRPPNIWH